MKVIRRGNKPAPPTKQIACWTCTAILEFDRGDVRLYNRPATRIAAGDAPGYLVCPGCGDDIPIDIVTLAEMRPRP